MALTVRLETTAPGQGVFEIEGMAGLGDSLELAIQRNLDDRYLGDGQAWQTTPHWHWLPGIRRESGELTVSVGPQILDPVVASSNMALRVLVRTEAGETSGVLRTKGHLLGSPAAREPDGSEPLADLSAEPNMGLELDLEFPGETREPYREPAAAGGRSRWLLAGLLFLVLAAAGTGAWRLGWLDQWLSSDAETTARETSVQSALDAPAASAGTSSESMQEAPISNSPQKSTPTPETLRGIALARAFLAASPSPQAIHTEAERLEQAGDCDAAMVLYNRAAEADPPSALALAGRLDPQGFAVRGCFETPDETAASLWYRAATEAGDASAMRRLGQLLIERDSSGAQFEDGIRWLRRAARAGDREAQDLLAKLGSL